jgi:hypothetical protein
MIDEVIGSWRKQRREELHNLSSSPNIIRMIKSKSVKQAGHVACMAEMIIMCEIRNEYKVLVRMCKGMRPLENLHADGRILPK